MKLGFSLHIFEKHSNTKFDKNPSNGSRFVPCLQTDLTKLIIPSDVNEAWIFSTYLRKTFKYQIWQKSIQWQPICSMPTDRPYEGNNPFFFAILQNAPTKPRNLLWILSTVKPDLCFSSTKRLNQLWSPTNLPINVYRGPCKHVGESRYTSIHF